jgi:hypothetical protein
VSRIFESSGLSGPPCGVPCALGETTPPCHHACFQIPSDETKHSPVVDLLREFLHQKVVIDAVKEFLQVHVHHKPATFGDILPGRLDRLMGVPPRSEAVARSGKVRLKDR